MTVPQDFATPVERVVVEVETARGSGRFVVDERLRAVRIDLASDATLSRAQVAVRIDDGFDGLAARRRFHPDLRMVIRTDEADASARTMLFDGYPAEQTWRREASASNAVNTYAVELRSVYARLADDPRAQVFGRRMRTATILDGLLSEPARFADKSALVEALPCIFNLAGLGNRAAEPLFVVDRAGKTRRICVFTYDGDPQGVRWSLLDALRYLVWFHHLPEGPVSVAEVLDATECAASLDPAARGEFVPPTALVDRLLAPVADLSCEAMTLVAAAAKVAAASRAHVTCMAGNDAGACKSRMEVWAAADGLVRRFALAWGGRHADGVPRYDTSRATPVDVFTANQLRQAIVHWRDDEIVNAPIVVGGVRAWEITVPLVPGWLPEAGLDNVAAPDRDAAKGAALTPDLVDFLGEDAELVEWFRKYHRDGSEFAAHKNVGRLWVLNEDGAFGAAYNRNPPFDAYAPFDFATVANAAKPAGSWTRRPRPMAHPIAPDAEGEARAVFVEASFDSGATWHPMVGSVRVLPDRAGVWLGAFNLTSIIPPGGDWYDTNLWYAMVDQVFRLRATAAFADDARLVVRRAADGLHTPTGFSRTRLSYKPGLYRFAGRTQTVNALYEAAPNAGGEVDATDAAGRAAAALATAEQAGRVEADVAIPWLDTDFAIGARIRDLHGRDIGLNGVAASANLAPPVWTVVGKTFRFAAPAAGGSHGPLVETTFALVRDVEAA